MSQNRNIKFFQIEYFLRSNAGKPNSFYDSLADVLLGETALWWVTTSKQMENHFSSQSIEINNSNYFSGIY